MLSLRSSIKPLSNPHDVIDYAPRRSDVIVIPALNSASIRSAKDEEWKKTFDWESELTALGMTGDALALALMRKKRSTAAKEMKKEGEKEDSIFPSTSKSNTGWGAATGTMIL